MNDIFKELADSVKEFCEAAKRFMDSQEKLSKDMEEMLSITREAARNSGFSNHKNNNNYANH